MVNIDWDFTTTQGEWEFTTQHLMLGVSPYDSQWKMRLVGLSTGEDFIFIY